MDLGLLQGEEAKHIGVSEDCLCYSENGHNEPRLDQFPGIIAFLGYCCSIRKRKLSAGMLRYKYEHRLSKRKLAKLFGVDAITVASWERNEQKPLKRSMKIVLSLISKNTR